MTSVVFQEALSRNTFAGFTIGALVHTDMASPHLMHAGNPSQIEKYMPGIVSGDCLTAVAISEPNMGSDVAAIQTKAEKLIMDLLLMELKFISQTVSEQTCIL